MWVELWGNVLLIDDVVCYCGMIGYELMCVVVGCVLV